MPAQSHRSPTLALTDTLTLKSSAGASHTFNLLYKDINGTKRIDVAGTLTEPGPNVIKHTTSGQGVNIVDRHLIQFSKTLLDALGVPRTATVNMTIALPRSVVLTNTVVADLISYLVSLITDGSFSATTGMAGTTNLASLLRNES